jgi:hypothetical protein
MSVRGALGAAVACLVVTVAYAGSSCDGPSSQQFRDCLRIVDSLRPDKAGQARVFAADGSIFTTDQAQWMQGQLHEVARLCASHEASDQAEAARLLGAVRELIRSHQRNSQVAHSNGQV